MKKLMSLTLCLLLILSVAILFSEVSSLVQGLFPYAKASSVEGSDEDPDAVIDSDDLFGDGSTTTNADKLIYQIEDGQVTIIDCDASASGALEIPATIEGYSVTTIGSSAFYHCSSSW